MAKAKAKAKKTAAKKPAAKKSPAKKTAKPAVQSAKKSAGKTSVKKVSGKATAKAKAKVTLKPKPASKSAKPVASKAGGKTKASTATKSQTSATPAGGKSSSNIKWDQFLTPLDDRLIVEITAGEKMTAGGLYIPDTVSDTSGNYKGLVLVAGRGHRDQKGKIHPMDVQAGDTVLFSEFTGAKMDLMGKEVRILRESEILGIVTKK